MRLILLSDNGFDHVERSELRSYSAFTAKLTHDTARRKEGFERVR